MLWHRQAIFKSKGDKLCSSAESRIWTRGPRHQIASRLNARWQTDWAIEDQAKTWTRQPVPMISEHSAHLTPLSVDFRTWLWRYTYVVVNFDALAHASDIQIERRQVVFLCWKQDLNPGSQTPNRQQTECSLTNRLSYRGSSKNLNSTARPYAQRAFSPLYPTVSWLSHLALAIYIFVVVNLLMIYWWPELFYWQIGLWCACLTEARILQFHKKKINL